jgi:hypothetical protein
MRKKTNHQIENLLQSPGLSDIDKVTLVLWGNSQMGIKGMVERIDKNSQYIRVLIFLNLIILLTLAGQAGLLKGVESIFLLLVKAIPAL